MALCLAPMKGQDLSLSAQSMSEVASRPHPDKGPEFIHRAKPTRPWFFWNELGLFLWLNSSCLDLAISRISFFESFSSLTEPWGCLLLAKVLHGFLRVSSQYPILWKIGRAQAFQHHGAWWTYTGVYIYMHESIGICHRITTIRAVSRDVSPLRLVRKP